MMQNFVILAKGYGYNQLHLSVHVENYRAVSFYEKLGWERSYHDGVWNGKMTKMLGH